MRTFLLIFLFACAGSLSYAGPATTLSRAPRAQPAEAPLPPRAEPAPAPQADPLSGEIPALSRTAADPVMNASPTQPARMPHIERTTRKVLAKWRLQPQRLRWWHFMLATIIILFVGAVVLTKAKGWEMTSASIGINFIRLAGVTLVLFFLGLVLYGIITGGNV
ncbi:MAG: hypothetical protein KF690_07240 [Bacteroidetes bacterium]|nr:hypothetical protein [Bacteroidota bacterium]